MKLAKCSETEKFSVKTRASLSKGPKASRTWFQTKYCINRGETNFSRSPKFQWLWQGAIYHVWTSQIDKHWRHSQKRLQKYDIRDIKIPPQQPNCFNLARNIWKGFFGGQISLRAASKLISVTTLETPRKYDLILKIDFFVKNVNWRLVCVFLPVLVPETACILH